MQIDNEFTVGAPIDRAWEVLTDLEGIAPCLPGARLTGVDGDVHSGKVKIKVGPVTSEYAGTARFVEQDEADHRAVISAAGRDSRGAGNASATITARLSADGDRTVVSVATDLKITGKIAQFGSGMIKEISAKLLGQFAQNLEDRLVVPATTAAAPPVEAATTPVAPVASAAASVSERPGTATTLPDTSSQVADGTVSGRTITPERDVEALDLMAVAGGSIYKRLVPVAVVVVLAVAVVGYFVAR